jgi:hypothetical protein
MQRFAIILALLLSALLPPGPLLAQGRWKLPDTAGQSQSEYIQAAWKEEWQRLLQQPTSVDTGGANLATTTKDLQPDMALAGLLGQSSTDAGQGTVVYDLNFLLPGLFGPQGSKNAQLQGVVNTRPQVSDAVRNALPAAQRDDLAGKLKDRIGGLGDASIRFTFAPATRWLGRSFKQYEQTFRDLCTAALGNRTQPPLSVAEADSLADAAGLTLYHQLVNNQPQLLLTAEKKHRDPLVGPNELGVKLTYEWSPMSLKEAMKAGYTTFVKENQDAIQKGDRFSLSAEYTSIEGETVDTHLPGIAPIVLKPVRKLILHGGYGCNLTLPGGEPVKLDIEADYEDVSDDPARQDRGIARLTFTRMMGKMQASAGIVYANHSEFLSGVDARFSAHVGLRIGMFNDTAGNP